MEYIAGRQAGDEVGWGRGSSSGFSPLGGGWQWPLGTAVFGATNPATGEVSMRMLTLAFVR